LRIICHANHNVPFIYSGIGSSRSSFPAGSDSFQKEAAPEAGGDSMLEKGEDSDPEDLPEQIGSSKVSPKAGSDPQPQAQVDPNPKAGGDPELKKRRKPRSSG
jgi:hypothetical protein